MVSLSMVMAKGMPISSVRAYFFPMVTPLLSVLHEMPIFFSEELICLITCANSSEFTTGRIEHFTGAILGGNLKQHFWGSSLWQNECSISAYSILPIPKEGSITLGVNFSSRTFTVFLSNWTCSFLRTSDLPSITNSFYWAVSNSAIRASLSSSLRASTCLQRRVPSFLSSLPILALSSLMLICSRCWAVLNLRAACSFCPVALLWAFRSYADLSAIPTHSTHPEDISISASQQSLLQCAISSAMCQRNRTLLRLTPISRKNSYVLHMKQASVSLSITPRSTASPTCTICASSEFFAWISRESSGSTIPRYSLNFSFLLSSGSTKYSISAIWNSLHRISQFRGAISFLKPSPIQAAPKGSLYPFCSRSLGKLRKMPCAVSGRKKASTFVDGPIDVGHIKLNGTGSVSSFPVSGAFIAYFFIISVIWAWLYPSTFTSTSLYSYLSPSAVFLSATRPSSTSVTTLSALYGSLVLESSTSRSENLSTCPEAFRTVCGVIQVVVTSSMSSSMMKCSLQYCSMLVLMVHPTGPQSQRPATPPQSTNAGWQRKRRLTNYSSAFFRLVITYLVSVFCSIFKNYRSTLAKQLLIMEQKQVLSNDALVYIKHQDHLLYLKSNPDQLLLKTKKSYDKHPLLRNAIKQLVWGNDGCVSQDHLWQIVKCSSLVDKRVTQVDHLSTQLWRDDFVFLKHHASQTYLIGYNEEYAFSSKKESHLPLAVFIIKKKENGGANPIVNGDVVRLINVVSQADLTSKFKLFPKTTDSGSSYYQLRFERKPDFWTIELAQGNPIAELPRPLKRVRHEDRIILRSSATGGSLHSHERSYKYGGGEVTWWPWMPRDCNDWWVLIGAGGTVLPSRCKISLIHCATKKYLSYVGKHDQVCTLSGECTLFEWELIKVETEEKGDTLGVEQPFIIRHIATNRYLQQTLTKGKITTSQFIVGLSGGVDEYCIWQVEQCDSIFA